MNLSRQGKAATIKTIKGRDEDRIAILAAIADSRVLVLWATDEYSFIPAKQPFQRPLSAQAERHVPGLDDAPIPRRVRETRRSIRP